MLPSPENQKELDALNQNPLNTLCRRRLVEEGQEPWQDDLHSAQLARWALENFPEYRYLNQVELDDRLPELLADLAPRDLQSWFLLGQEVELSPEEEVDLLTQRFQNQDAQSLAYQLLQNAAWNLHPR